MMILLQRGNCSCSRCCWNVLTICDDVVCSLFLDEVTTVMMMTPCYCYVVSYYYLVSHWIMISSDVVVILATGC
jgi:hypothetical protein